MVIPHSWGWVGSRADSVPICPPWCLAPPAAVVISIHFVLRIAYLKNAFLCGIENCSRWGVCGYNTLAEPDVQQPSGEEATLPWMCLTVVPARL